MGLRACFRFQTAMKRSARVTVPRLACLPLWFDCGVRGRSGGSRPKAGAVFRFPGARNRLALRTMSGSSERFVDMASVVVLAAAACAARCVVVIFFLCNARDAARRRDARRSTSSDRFSLDDEPCAPIWADTFKILKRRRRDRPLRLRDPCVSDSCGTGRRGVCGGDGARTSRGHLLKIRLVYLPERVVGLLKGGGVY